MVSRQGDGVNSGLFHQGARLGGMPAMIERRHGGHDALQGWCVRPVEDRASGWGHNGQPKRPVCASSQAVVFQNAGRECGTLRYLGGGSSDCGNS